MQPRPVNRQAIGQAISIPAPVGGWNTRDALADMPPTDAVRMENVFPGTDSVYIRPGHIEHGDTGTASPVRTVRAWRGAASDKLVAMAGGGVWDVTATGAATPIAAAATYTNDYWQTTMFNGRLHAVNGNDAAWNYDGTNLVASTWTGPTNPNDLIQVMSWKGRLYFVEQSSGLFWYGDVGAHTGALTSFDVGQIAQRGGYLVALGSWSVMEAGVGLDDRFVAIMSTGEILVYNGISPADSATWSLSGSYFGAEPLGIRCTVNLGGELIVLTKNGYLPMSVLIQDGTIDALENHPVWGKIRQAIQTAASSFADTQGWEAFLTPSGDCMIFNSPQSVQFTEQHCLNPVSGAWSLYTALNAITWAELAGNVYFGRADGKVYRLEGATDNGEAINFAVDQAFSYFGSRTRTKRFTALRPLFDVDGELQAVININIDFRYRRGTGSVVDIGAPSGTGAKWNTSKWNEGRWARGSVANPVWLSSRGLGRAASISISGSTQAQNLVWYATDYLGQFGGLR